MNATTRIGLFLRLLDKDHRLSLTNIAVICSLVKFMLTKDAVAPMDLGALIGTLLSYQAKKVIEGNQPK